MTCIIDVAAPSEATAQANFYEALKALHVFDIERGLILQCEELVDEEI